MSEAPPCVVCEGTGLVAPSPFLDDVVSWPAHLAFAAGLLTAGAPWGSSATAAGLTRPLDCPACGGVRAVPVAVLIPDFLGGVPVPPAAPPRAGKRELAERMRLEILSERKGAP